MAAAVSGFFFLIFSRIVCCLLLQTKVGLAFATWLHKVAPFDFIGTALGTLLLAGTLIKISNMLVSEQVAAFWLYHRGDMDPLMRILWSSYVGVEPSNAPGAIRLSFTIVKEMFGFLWRQFQFKAFLRALWNIRETLALTRFRGLAFSKLQRGPLRSVMVNLKDGKVIVGYVTDLLTTKPSIEFVTIAPVWTGYRDSSSRVLKTVDYSATVAEAKASPGGVSNLKDIEPFSRVIRIADIATASVFHPGAFKIRESEAHFGETNVVPVQPPKNLWEWIVLAFRGNR